MSFTPSSGRGPTMRMAAASPLRAALFGLASLGTGLVLVAAPDPGHPDPVAVASTAPDAAAPVDAAVVPADACPAVGCGSEVAGGETPSAAAPGEHSDLATAAHCALTAIQIRSELLGHVATPLVRADGPACNLVPDLSEPVTLDSAGGLVRVRVDASPIDPGSATVAIIDVAGTEVMGATIALDAHGVDCTSSPPGFTSGDWEVAEVTSTNTGSTVPGQPAAGLAVLGVHRSETITDPEGAGRVWRALRVEIGVPGPGDGLSVIEVIVGEATAGCV